MLQEGQRFGRYQLGELIGRGGMGQVWRARPIGPTGPGQELALKVLRADAADRDDKALERFLKEGRLGSLVRHPNVVRVLDGGEVGLQPYMAMELVDGLPLDKLLKSHGALEPRPLLDVALQGALGLAALHDLGVTQADDVTLVHRDVKPGNFVVDVRGRVKLLDFGIATLAGRDEVTAVMGTLGYMSPEQLFGRDVDARSDLFALGVTLYHAATGERLFSSSAIGVVVDELRAIDDRLRRGVMARLDQALPGLGRVLGGCLRYDPDDRYADAHELWAALDGLNASVPDLPTLASLVRGTAPPPAAPAFAPGTSPSMPGSSLVATCPVVGRDREIVRLATAAARSRCVLVTGPPGIGKTALARETFPQAVWVDVSACGGVTGLEGAIGAAFGFLGQVDLGMLLPLTSAEVIVLDGLGHTSREVAESLEAWIAAAPHTTWVVTCPEAPRLTAVDVRVGALDLSASVELLLGLAPGTPKAELRRVARRLEGLPLALELAGRALAQGQNSLTQVDPGIEKGLRAALDWSWRRTARVERQALVQLTVFEGPFELEDAEAVLELETERAVGEVVEALVLRGLVRLREDGLQLTPVLRDYARSRQDAFLDAGAQRHLRVRHAARMAELGTAEGLHATRGPEAAEALDTLLAARADLEAALRFSLAVGAGTTAAQCACALYCLAEAGRVPAPDTKLYRRTLDQRFLSDRERTRLRLWRARYERLDDATETLRVASKARDEAKAAGELLQEAEARSLIADALISQNHFARAVPELKAALRLARKVKDRRVEAFVLRSSARRLSRMGRNAKALDQLQRARSLVVSIGDPSLLGIVLGLEGLVLARMGEARAAMPLLIEAAEALEGIGRAHHAGLAWSNVDYACRSLDREVARDARKRATRLLLQGGAISQAAAVRTSDAQDLCEMGRIDEALQVLDEVIRVALARRDDELLADVLGDRLSVELVAGRYDDARRHYLEAVRAAEAVRMVRRRFVLGYIRGRLALDEGRVDVAAKASAQIARAAEQHESIYLRGLAVHLEALVALDGGDVQTGLEQLELALADVIDVDASMALEIQALRVRLLAGAGRVDEARRVLASGRQLVAERQLTGGLADGWLDAAEAELP